MTNNFSQTIDKAFVENNVLACVRPHTEDEVATMPLADLDLYFRCVLSDSDEGVNSFKVTKDLMKNYGLEMCTLRSRALSKAAETVTCKTMAETLGMPADDDLPLYVLSTENMIEGAGSALLYTAKLKELAHRLNEEKLFVIPSSIHEVLALPMDEDMRDGIDQMIQAINKTQVLPEERLSSHVYVFDSVTEKIS